MDALEPDQINGGWIKLWRQLLVKEHYFQSPILLPLLNYLLLSANYRRSTIRWDGKERTLEPGQVLVSVRGLAIKLKRHKTSIVRAISVYIEDKICVQECVHGGTILTFCNWKKFQVSEKEVETPLCTPISESVSTLCTPCVLSEEGKKERIKKEPNTLSSSGDDHPAQKFVLLWNENCGSLPKVSKLSSKRKSHVMARLKDNASLDHWKDVFIRVTKSNFLMGLQGNLTWTATFDWVIKPDSHIKVMEGVYDNKEKVSSTKTRLETLLQGVEEREARITEGMKR